jgi:hypothetical protein
VFDEGKAGLWATGPNEMQAMGPGISLWSAAVLSKEDRCYFKMMYQNESSPTT